MTPSLPSAYARVRPLASTPMRRPTEHLGPGLALSPTSRTSIRCQQLSLRGRDYGYRARAVSRPLHQALPRLPMPPSCPPCLLRPHPHHPSQPQSWTVHSHRQNQQQMLNRSVHSHPHELTLPQSNSGLTLTLSLAAMDSPTQASKTLASCTSQTTLGPSRKTQEIQGECRWWRMVRRHHSQTPMVQHRHLWPRLQMQTQMHPPLAHPWRPSAATTGHPGRSPLKALSHTRHTQPCKHPVKWAVSTSTTPTTQTTEDMLSICCSWRASTPCPLATSLLTTSFLYRQWTTRSFFPSMLRLQRALIV